MGRDFSCVWATPLFHSVRHGGWCIMGADSSARLMIGRRHFNQPKGGSQSAWWVTPLGSASFGGLAFFFFLTA